MYDMYPDLKNPFSHRVDLCDTLYQSLHYTIIFTALLYWSDFQWKKEITFEFLTFTKYGYYSIFVEKSEQVFCCYFTVT